MVFFCLRRVHNRHALPISSKCLDFDPKHTQDSENKKTDMVKGVNHSTLTYGAEEVYDLELLLSSC